MKNPRLTIMSAAMLVAMALVPSAVYAQDEPTATEAQKRVMQPCRCNEIVTEIASSTDHEGLRKLIDDAFSEPCAYENYEKFVLDAKAAAPAAAANAGYLDYAIALARVEQLSALSKNNDIEAGRLYMAVNDKYFGEAVEHMDKVSASASSKGLIIDNNLLRFLVYREKLQGQKSDAAFDAIASQIAKYTDDAGANRAELEKISGRLKRLGLTSYAIKLKMLYASKVDPEEAKGVMDEIRMAADRYFDQNDMKEAASLYDQYLSSAPAYYNKEEIGARIMEVAEKYFSAGKYRDAKKYYGIYMEKCSELPPADYCAYKLALASYYMKDHIRTISQLEGFLEKYRNSAWFDKAFEMLARVYYENLPRDKAIESIRSLIDRYYRKDAGDYARVLIAMLYYRAKNYDMAEDELKKIAPTSSSHYAARMITDDINEIRVNKALPAFGSDIADTYKVWDPYQGIEARISPTLVGGAAGTREIEIVPAGDGTGMIEVNKGATVNFTVQTLVDEDRFNEFATDKEDQSRLPKMIKEETERDLLALHWSVDGGNFADNKETESKVWKAPNDPGTYKLAAKVEDFGLVRVPSKGVRKDPSKELSLTVVVR